MDEPNFLSLKQEFVMKNHDLVTTIISYKCNHVILDYHFDEGRSWVKWVEI